MLTQRTANIIFSILIVIAAGYFAYVAQGFKASGLLASAGLPSKFFPQLLLAITAICAVIVALHYLLNGHAGGDEGETVFANGGEAIRGLLVLGVAVLCYFVWRHVGFIPMATMMGPLCLLAMGVRSVKHYVVTLALAGFIYLVFTHLLNIQLT